jgi:hypothetical protein
MKQRAALWKAPASSSSTKMAALVSAYGSPARAEKEMIKIATFTKDGRTSNRFVPFRGRFAAPVWKLESRLGSHHQQRTRISGITPNPDIAADTPGSTKMTLTRHCIRSPAFGVRLLI